MLITEYGLELTEKQIPFLVKIKSVRYGEERDYMNSPEKIAEMLNKVFRLGYQAEEQVYIVGLNAKTKPLAVFRLSHGTASTSYMNTRETMIRLLLSGSVYFVAAHNHPSGDLIPSNADKDTSKKLREVGEMIGIEMLDSIIVTRNDYASIFND